MAVHPGPLGGAVSNHRYGRPQPRRRRSPFRVRDWRMRTKLGAVLVIPSVAFLVLAGVQTSSLVTQATELNEFSQQTAVADEVGDLIHALQQERDRTAGELAAPRPGGTVDAFGLTAAVRPLAEATDDAATSYRAAAGPLARGDVSWRVAYTKTVELIDQLPALRTAATGTATPQAIFDSYTRTIDGLLALLAEPSPGPSRPELSEAVLRGAQMARVKELGSRIRAYLYAAARRGVYTPDDFVVLGDLRSQRIAALSDFRLAATPEQARYYDDVSVLPPFLAATRLEEATPSGTGRRLLEADPWWTASQDRLGQLRVIESRVLGDAASEAAQRSGDQLRRTLAVAGFVLLVLLVGLWTSYHVGRSIVRSLRVLRTHALQVAQVQLPDALERLRAPGSHVPAIEVAPSAVRSLDEIGEVAEAFVAVHRSAVNVAIDQALMRRSVNAMFVNLARRSQVLVERQLELLDELEREEGDPDQLDNLFKLDHLAARMRRNDDSLLVLAGSEATRRWSEPVALPAVVLAAVAEIEHYPRVRHDAIDPVHVVGHAVADVVHLLAELLENATAFSPPTTAVQVVARGSEQAGAIIEISDDGLGMSPAALQEANDLLAAPPAADVAASERMGLFVVSHLAARHRIRVELRGAHRGLIAVVRLPADLIAPAHAQLPYQPSRPVLASVSAFAAGPSGERVARGSIESGYGQPAYDGNGRAAYAGGNGQGAPDYGAPGQGSPGYGAPAYGSPGQGSPGHGSPGYGSPGHGSPGYGAPGYGAPTEPTAPVQPAYTPAPGWSQPAPAPPAPVSAVPVSGLPVSGVPVSAPPPPGRLTVPPGPGIPVAGRQPGSAATPWSGGAAPTPTAPRQRSSVASTWWARPTAGAPAPRETASRPAAGPPATPVTGGVSASGLPMRVPMAQLPTDAPPPVPAPRTETDPNAVGSTLSAFYGGVRRAESEETTDLSALAWSRREQESR